MTFDILKRGPAEHSSVFSFPMLKRLTDIDRILKFDSSEVYCKIMWKTFAFFCFFIPLLQATPLELGAGKNQQIKRTIPDCESTYVEPNECAGWVSDCQNSMYVTWMRANCKVTCGVCKGLPPPYLTPEKITFDVSECLAANNLNRSKHGAPNLQWDASLASGSANWALYLAQKSEVQLEHSVANGQYGENIYYSATSVVGTVASCKKAVESWYAEIKDYDFNNPGFSHSTGHFTQVVWKATTKVGVGVAAVTKNGFTYTFVVARYTPAGNMNMPGYFAANVLSPSK